LEEEICFGPGGRGQAGERREGACAVARQTSPAPGLLRGGQWLNSSPRLAAAPGCERLNIRKSDIQVRNHLF
jgi:hypothetical protein